VFAREGSRRSGRRFASVAAIVVARTLPALVFRAPGFTPGRLVGIMRHQTTPPSEGDEMSNSVYRVMEIIGSSPNSWEEAAKIAVEKAGIHREDLRVAEVIEFDLKIDNKQVVAFRSKVKISYKYHEVV
jgi:flavin-binding protein dodecin